MAGRAKIVGADEKRQSEPGRGRAFAPRGAHGPRRKSERRAADNGTALCWRSALLPSSLPLVSTVGTAQTTTQQIGYIAISMLSV